MYRLIFLDVNKPEGHRLKVEYCMATPDPMAYKDIHAAPKSDSGAADQLPSPILEVTGLHFAADVS